MPHASRNAQGSAQILCKHAFSLGQSKSLVHSLSKSPEAVVCLLVLNLCQGTICMFKSKIMWSKSDQTYDNKMVGIGIEFE